MFGISTLLTLASAALAVPSQVSTDSLSTRSINGVEHTLFEHAATGAKFSFVRNSGVCETTPGVNQYSGYISVSPDVVRKFHTRAPRLLLHHLKKKRSQHTFFWFFAARHNAPTAPLAVWLNGGPGCSSMFGLFIENGPCTFNNVNGSTPELNPYSWNEFSNVLYIDQPVGAGFSYGSDTGNSTP